MLNHAYREWILNDDQNNMYAALVALHDPAQQKLAQVTWGQAAAAYQSSDALLGRLGAALRDPVENLFGQAHLLRPASGIAFTR